MSQITTNPSYIVKVGEQGKSRLEILNQVFRATSLAFLKRAGLLPGMKVVDAGCGIGVLTCEIADLVGESGHVYAIDIDESQLEIARAKAAELKIKNITFIKAAIEELQLLMLPKIDFIYERYVLMHLKPEYAEQTLRVMYQMLTPGGILACEEPKMSGMFAIPRSQALERSIEILMNCSKKLGLDFDLGESLHQLFQKIGCENMHIHLVRPVLMHIAEKQLCTMLLSEAQEKYIEQGVTTKEEVNKLLKQLAQDIANENGYIGTCENTQVSAVKPLIKLDYAKVE